MSQPLGMRQFTADPTLSVQIPTWADLFQDTPEDVLADLRRLGATL